MTLRSELFFRGKKHKKKVKIKSSIFNGGKQTVPMGKEGTKEKVTIK
jgi:hypothetical protein